MTRHRRITLEASDFQQVSPYRNGRTGELCVCSRTRVALLYQMWDAWGASVFPNADLDATLAVKMT